MAYKESADFISEPQNTFLLQFTTDLILFQLKMMINLDMLHILLMYNINHLVPNTKPCGTPQVIPIHKVIF